MNNIIYSQFSFSTLGHREQLDLMDVYYNNNDLYEATRILKYYLGVWNENIRPLRTPVHRSVEFYVSKIAIGEPAISAKNKNQSLVEAVTDVMEWSNFQIQKPQRVRMMSLQGDLFCKVVSSNDKVWHEMIDAKDVTDFKEDARGFLTEIRIDTHIKEDDLEKTRTEYWTVNDNVPYMAVWTHILDENTPLDQLGTPDEFTPLYRFGIDFVPFVRSSFRDGTGLWGTNCVQHALLKVDEANRQATRLHQILYRYNKPLWAISANATAEDGSPMPAPTVRAEGNSGGKDIEVRDDTLLYLDGTAKMDSLIPNLPYAEALQILESQEHELEKDLPELLYYSLPDKIGADASGKALRNLLGAAVDRATQAQSNFVEGLVRLNQMAITIGQFLGFFDKGLGTFDGGELAHSIKFADQFPHDSGEQATILQTYVSALGSVNLKVAMKLAGFSEEVINEIKIPEPVIVNDTVSTGADSN